MKKKTPQKKHSFLVKAAAFHFCARAVRGCLSKLIDRMRNLKDYHPGTNCTEIFWFRYWYVHMCQVFEFQTIKCFPSYIINFLFIPCFEVRRDFLICWIEMRLKCDTIHNKW